MARPLLIYDYLSLFVKHIWELVIPGCPLDSARKAVRHRRPGVPLASAPTADCPHPLPEFGVGNQQPEGVDEGGRIVDHKARTPRFDRLGSSARSSGDDRKSRRCRFEEHNPESLCLQTKPA